VLLEDAEELGLEWEGELADISSRKIVPASGLDYTAGLSARAS